jgi:hypothetical protein
MIGVAHTRLAAMVSMLSIVTVKLATADLNVQLW